MKKIKKIVGLILSLCLTFGAFSSIVSLAAEEAGAEAAYEKNMESAYTAMRFKEEFLFITVSRSVQSSELVYPDNFGGIYIDDNNELHITYTENKETLMNKVGEDEAIFEKVDYGYNYLCEIYEYITNLMADIPITHVGISETNNRICVSVDLDYRTQLIDILEENCVNFKKEAISFFDSQIITTTAAAGTGIIMSLGGCTAGYNAQDYDGNYGFVTCGHAASGLWETVYNLDGSTLGTVTYRSYISGTKVDASFVEYENQSEKSSQYLGTESLVGTISSASLSEGMNVSKYGNKTGEQSGTIIYVTCSVLIKEKYANGQIINRQLFDQIYLDIRQEKGDSGALLVLPMVGPVLGNTTRPCQAIGIVTLGEEDVWEKGWASKIENINSRFDLTTYIVV